MVIDVMALPTRGGRSSFFLAGMNGVKGQEEDVMIQGHGASSGPIFDEGNMNTN